MNNVRELRQLQAFVDRCLKGRASDPFIGALCEPSTPRVNRPTWPPWSALPLCPNPRESLIGQGADLPPRDEFTWVRDITTASLASAQAEYDDPDNQLVLCLGEAARDGIDLGVGEHDPVNTLHCRGLTYLSMSSKGLDPDLWNALGYDNLWINPIAAIVGLPWSQRARETEIALAELVWMASHTLTVIVKAFDDDAYILARPAGKHDGTAYPVA